MPDLKRRSSLPICWRPGDRRRGRTESKSSSEGGGGRHQRESLCASGCLCLFLGSLLFCVLLFFSFTLDWVIFWIWRPAALLANSELDLGREELHHHLPLPHGPLQVGKVIIISCSVEDHLLSHHQLEFIKFSRIKTAYSVAAMLSIINGCLPLPRGFFYIHILYSCLYLYLSLYFIFIHQLMFAVAQRLEWNRSPVWAETESGLFLKRFKFWPNVFEKRHFMHKDSK